MVNIDISSTNYFHAYLEDHIVDLVLLQGVICLMPLLDIVRQ